MIAIHCPYALKVYRLFAEAGWSFVGAGASRLVLRKGNECMKLPRALAFYRENAFEHMFCQNDWQGLSEHVEFCSVGFQIVKAYHEVKGIPLPFNPYEMQKAEGAPVLRGELLDVSRRLSIPWWEFFADGYQAGWSSSNKPLLYDYNFWASSRWLATRLQPRLQLDYGEDEARRLFDAIVSLVPWETIRIEAPQYDYNFWVTSNGSEPA